LKLVGFGCSFTYGSELIDPELEDVYHNDTESYTWDRHHANTRYRESNVWLGQLAKSLDATWDNRAEPANSNFAIAQQVADYFINLRNPNEKIVVCVGWSERTRMSWYGKRWVHNGFANDEHDWSRSAREWVLNSNNASHDMFTQNAMLMVNSICNANNVQILQFNALGNHKSTTYPNYFLGGASMDSMLKRAMQDDPRLDLVASGGHPNAAGHEYFTIRLHDFAKERII